MPPRMKLLPDYRATITHSVKCKTPEAPGGKCYCDAKQIRELQAKWWMNLEAVANEVKAK